MIVRVVAALGLPMAFASPAGAQLASPQVVPNVQPSLALYYGIDGGGFVRTFSSSFLPGGLTPADGREMLIAERPLTFASIGTFFGGDGVTTFRAPDLSGRAVVGASSSLPVGSTVGSETNTLTTSEFPATIGGGGLAYDNRQPSMALRYLIRTQGYFPGFDRVPPGPFIGQMALFAGSVIPEGWMVADGRELSVADLDTEGLFQTIGTTFGGNGFSTFALPDMRDRLALGTDYFSPLGSFGGSETTTITPGNVALEPVVNMQPWMAINYTVVQSGMFPGLAGGEDPGFPSATGFYLGEVLANVTWLPSSRGGLLPIIQNQALFSLLGTNFGGDGRITFGLPDLRGRTIIGAGASALASDRSLYAVGDRVGVPTYTLALGDVQPPTTSVPEPSTLALLAAGVGLLAVVRRRAT